VLLLIDAAWRTGLFILLSAALMVPFERVATGARRTCPEGRRASTVGSLALFFFNSIVAAIAAAYLWRLAPVAVDPAAAADWPRFGLALLLTEIGSYWLHRAMHASRWLWRFHRLHHHGAPLRWIDAWRMHPVDALLHILVGAAPALLLQVPLLAHAPLLLLRKLYTEALHADGAWATPPASSRFRRLLATPAFHHRHHDEQLPPANFAGLLAALDVLFGTWRPRQRPAPAPSAQRLST